MVVLIDKYFFYNIFLLDWVYMYNVFGSFIIGLFYLIYILFFYKFYFDIRIIEIFLCIYMCVVC